MESFLFFPPGRGRIGIWVPGNLWDPYWMMREDQGQLKMMPEVYALKEHLQFISISLKIEDECVLKIEDECDTLEEYFLIFFSLFFIFYTFLENIGGTYHPF